jgi:hypothetical protein
MDTIDVLKNWVNDLKDARRNRNNSYKYVWGLCLLSYIKEKGTEHNISYEEVFQYFAKTYWNNVVNYNFRESVSRFQEAKFQKIIQEITIEYPHLISTRFYDAITIQPNLLEIIENKIGNIYETLNNPISRFSALGDGRTEGAGNPQGECWAYSWDKPNRIIKLHKNVIKNLIPILPTLIDITLYEWALFIEKYNSSPSTISKLFEHIDLKDIRQPIPIELVRILKNNLPWVCFYCNKNLIEDNSQENNYDIDHFIPHSFVYDHPIWDLVPCCKKCNRGENGKFSKLPTPKDDQLTKLNQRNQALMEKPEFNYLFKNFNNIKELETFCERQYEICKASGFSMWENT